MQGHFLLWYLSPSLTVSAWEVKVYWVGTEGVFRDWKSFCHLQIILLLLLTACLVKVNTGESPKQGTAPFSSFSNSSEEPVLICSNSLFSHINLWVITKEGISLLNLCRVTASYHFLLMPRLFESSLFNSSGSSLLLFMVFKVTISIRISWPKEKEHGDLRKPLWG